MGGNNEFLENFERNKYLKKLPSMQRVKDGNFVSQHTVGKRMSVFVNRTMDEKILTSGQS